MALLVRDAYEALVHLFEDVLVESARHARITILKKSLRQTLQQQIVKNDIRSEADLQPWLSAAEVAISQLKNESLAYYTKKR